MTPEQIEEIKKFYKPPFRYDDYGQMIWDYDCNRVIDIRGWGSIKGEKRAISIQDNFGRLVTDLLNEKLGGDPVRKPKPKERYCKCGCGLNISRKHINAKFFNKRHKDDYWNQVNPRGYGSEESDQEAAHEAGLEAQEEGWDGHKNV